MIDFHAHILPGADHGSDSLATSLRQLQLAEAAGVRTIVATPHYYPQADAWEEFARRRRRSYELLRENYSGPIQILLGAEVHMCNGLDHLAQLEELFVAGTEVLLLELSFHTWNSGTWETLERFADERFTTVLAHVDRYDPERIQRLFHLGLLGQVNAEGLCRLMGRKRLLRWIDQGNIVALGSDIHGTDVGYTEWNKAVKRLGSRSGLIQSRAGKLLSSRLDRNG